MPVPRESRAERLARWLIRRACSQLPGPTRADRYREWTAELHAIFHDPQVPSRARRNLRGLLYAADQNRGARQLGPRPGHAVRARAGQLWRMRTPSGHRLAPAVMMLVPPAVAWLAINDSAFFIAFAVLWLIAIFRPDAPGDRQ